jgi:hypothetical protein
MVSMYLTADPQVSDRRPTRDLVSAELTVLARSQAADLKIFRDAIESAVQLLEWDSPAAARHVLTVALGSVAR